MLIPEPAVYMDEAYRFATPLPDSSFHLPIET